MSKAFDSLLHTLTLKKFEAYGFGLSSLNLMRSFFVNCKNGVKIENAKSEWKQMERRCPRGSSFGPVIWNLFQNDVAQQVTHSNPTKFVDDHQMYRTTPNLTMVKDNLEEQGKQAMSWYEENNLQANPKKFQTLAIDPRNVSISQQNEDISLNGRLSRITMNYNCLQ